MEFVPGEKVPASMYKRYFLITTYTIRLLLSEASKGEDVNKITQFWAIKCQQRAVQVWTGESNTTKPTLTSLAKPNIMSGGYPEKYNIALEQAARNTLAWKCRRID